MAQHPRLERMAGRAYQPERALEHQVRPVHGELPVFGQGLGGLVNQVLHRGAKRSGTEDQRVRYSNTGLTTSPVQPQPHCNGRRSHCGAQA